MNLKIIAIDETHGWDENFVQKTGKIHQLYLYDPSRVSYCCESTPSYELFPIAAVTEKGMDEEIFDVFIENRQFDIIYIHTYEIKNSPTYETKFPSFAFSEEFRDYKDDDKERGYVEYMDNIANEISCNIGMYPDIEDWK